MFGVVILAAGKSSRMGTPKMLLPWGRSSVLGHLIETWAGLEAAQVAVVCSAARPEVEAELARLSFPVENIIINPDPERGMFSSIQCAAQWSGWERGLTHFVVALGDQPHLRSETLQSLLRFAASHPESICQPARAGRPRHPAVLPAGVFRQLAVSDARNLKEFLTGTSVKVALSELNDPGLDLDLDSPADYEKARRL
jgi:molybdenum cofactor cytidylyltransferase